MALVGPPILYTQDTNIIIYMPVGLARIEAADVDVPSPRLYLDPVIV